MTRKSESSARGRQHRPSGTSTKKTRRKPTNDLRPEYDFASMRGGIRGKYAQRVRESSNIVVLEPDIAEAFPTEDAVNGALRALLNERVPTDRHPVSEYR